MLFSDEYDFSYVGAFGGRFLTPHIDRLASQGVRLTEAYSVTTVCNPSRFSVLTGLYPSHCRTQYIQDYSKKPGTLNVGFVFGIDKQTPSIARMLSAAGYRTGFAGKLGILGDPTVPPKTVDFGKPPKIDPDTPEGDAALKEWQAGYSRWLRDSIGFDYAASLYDNVDSRYPEKIRHHHIEWITQGALDFIDAEKTSGKPFYLHICPTTVHGPGHTKDLDADPSYTPGGRTTHHLRAHPARETIAKRLEAAGVPVNDDSVGMVFLDDMVGAIMQKLEAEGLAENTLFLLMPDHNVEPGKSTCNQKGTHVPVIIRWPGKIKPGSVCDQRISYVDMVPTMLEAAGAAPAADFKPDGLSLVPALTKGAKIDRDFLYFEMYTSRAILAGDYKYTAYRYNQQMIDKMKSGRSKVALDYAGDDNGVHASIAIRYAPGYFDLDQLYNVKNDIWEQQNLAANPEYKSKLEELRKQLVDFTQQFDKPFDLAVDPFCQTDEFKALAEKRRAADEKKKWWHNDFRYRSKVYDLEKPLDGM
jgi:arylsulfatase A-like enzyme